MSPPLAQYLPLRTPRTQLRLLQAADLDEFHAYRSDPEVGRYQGWYPMDRAHALRFLQAMSNVRDLRSDDWIQLGIADGGNDRLIGDIGLYLAPDGNEVELGFSLARALQGRGLAFEAIGAVVGLVLQRTAVRCCLAITDVRNARSMRLLERLGFARTGRQQTVVRGEACDEVVYRLQRVGATIHRPGHEGDPCSG